MDHRIEDLVVSGDMVYAGASLGLSVSDDRGEKFVHRSRYDESVGLSAGVDVLHVDGDTILAGFNNGINRSTDGGLSFTGLLSGTGSSQGLDAAGDSIYLATTDGLQVSHDNGGTFTQRTTAHGLPYDYLSSVAVSGDRVFVGCLNNGLGISTDRGQTFMASPGLSTGSVYGLTALGDLLYAATGSGLAISEDGGQSFVVRGEGDGLGSNRVNHALHVPSF